MNWYKKIKIAIPVPQAEDYPIPYGPIDYKGKGDPITKYNVETVISIDQNLKDTSIFKKYGPLKYIGSGTNGVAYYSTSKGNTVKITLDEGEYEAAKIIFEKQKLFEQLPVVKIFDFEKIDKLKTEKPLYIILIEKLDTSKSNNEITILQILYNFISRNSHYFDDSTLLMVKKRLYNLVNKKTEIDWNEFSNVADNFFNMSNSLIVNLDVKMGDVHPDNIGKRKDGSYAVLDLGYIF